MIYFILGAFSYVLNWPALDTNPMIKFWGVLLIFLAFNMFAILGNEIYCLYR